MKPTKSDSNRNIKSSRKKEAPRLDDIKPSEHKLILKFLNEAVRAEDLMFGMPETIHSHPKDPHPEHTHHDKHRHEIIKSDAAKKIIELRTRKFPLGFRHLDELQLIKDFSFDWLKDLIFSFSNAVLGEWNDFPVDIPRRGNMSRDGIVHAIMLKSGQVLFITGDETTLLWNPEDTNPLTTFEDPTNQPHLMPLGYSQVCSHHAQMSDADGSVLVVGGGGYGPNPLAIAGYIFNPKTKTWRRTVNTMVQNKWYPTVVTLGGKKMLIASGKTNDGDMEIFDETTESFSTLTGDDKIFPNLYPGLHILPNNAIFYSRTGFGTAGAGPGGVAYDDPADFPDRLGGKRPAYFTPNAIPNATPTGGTWTKITPSPIKRVKGMSVTLLKCTPPYVQIIVMGGTDALTNNTYELFDASTLTPTSSFAPAEPFPDGQNRSLPSGVLLPTGNLFVCGGISTTNSPCSEFDIQTNTWSARANLGSIRQYHSAAILLPSGKVMMAGWNNPKIEIYSPPYLFNGPQPSISLAPSLVHHGANFTIETPDAPDIGKVVFVRPMAVTHQTDSEQRVIELLPLVHISPTQLGLTAPDGGHPHPMAPRGHYMMFAINNAGVPSVAKWVYLH
jgi:WD40 repeat protein